MPDQKRNLVFLSHIHEESLLAQTIKEALEIEFGGFLDVFVSSDGTSIPAGANFLNKIEDALVHCLGAIYLVSPISIKRNWVNFELGAIWIRNAISLRSGQPGIPNIPFCHSGMKKNELPAPIGSLNAIDANTSAQLQQAFYSIQAALGGRGKLRTDFDSLASKVVEFESAYTPKAMSYTFGNLLNQNVDVSKAEEPYPAFISLMANLSSDEAKLLKVWKSNETAYGDLSANNSELKLRTKINSDLNRVLSHPERIMTYTNHLESLGLIQFMGYTPPDDWQVFYVLEPGEINGHIGFTAFGYDFLNTVLPAL